MRQIEQRVTRYLENDRIEELQRYWFHGLISGLISTDESTSEKFLATSKQIQGLTLIALQSPAGVPTPFELKLESQQGVTRLLYKVNTAQPWVLGEWSGDNINFVYRDDHGTWQDQWPPQNDRTDKILQLPVAVMLNRADSEDLPWMVFLVARREPREDWEKKLGF